MSRCSVLVSVAVLLVGGQHVYAQRVYWTEDTDSIHRANLDGSDRGVLVSEGLAAPKGIALDLIAEKMYWCETSGAKIQRANLDGTDVELQVMTGLFRPSQIALDVRGGKMYWTDASAKIQRANLEIPQGQTPYNRQDIEDLVVGLDGVSGLALDLTAGEMYWTIRATVGTGKIQRANLDGSEVEDILTQLYQPWTLALDLTARRIYWTEPSYQWGESEIRRANLDGSEAEVLIDGLSQPMGIALDLTAGRMYWTENYLDEVWRANLDGSGVYALMGVGVNLPRGIALDLRRSGGCVQVRGLYDGSRRCADLNNDGSVDLADYALFQAAFGNQ